MLYRRLSISIYVHIYCWNRILFFPALPFEINSSLLLLFVYLKKPLHSILYSVCVICIGELTIRMIYLGYYYYVHIYIYIIKRCTFRSMTEIYTVCGMYSSIYFFIFDSVKLCIGNALQFPWKFHALIVYPFDYI